MSVWFSLTILLYNKNQRPSCFSSKLFQLFLARSLSSPPTRGKSSLRSDGVFTLLVYKNVFLYSDDGNTGVLKDRYDDPLFAIPIDEFKKVLKQDYENSKADYDGKEGYRRFKWAKQLLCSMKSTKHEPLYVVMFGH